jgi:hypothetical protein
MALLRSEIAPVLAQKNRYFTSEKEANAYYSSLGNVVKKIDQWLMVLDDATSEELASRKAYIDGLIKERQPSKTVKYGINKAQEKLMRDVYYTQQDVYEVVLVSPLTPREFFYPADEIIGTYDDEVNGATPVRRGDDGVMLKEDLIDQND